MDELEGEPDGSWRDTNELALSGSIEDDIAAAMNITLFGVKLMFPQLSEMDVKAMIVSQSLRTLAQVLLEADTPGSGLVIETKQVILGLLATADWLDPADETGFPNAK